MKKIAVIILLFSCIFTGMVTASEFPILTNQIEIRQVHLEWMLAIQEIGMEAVIEYIDEISEGKGTAQLEGILAEFRAECEDIESYTTHVGLNNYLRGFKDFTRDFRTETQSRMNEYNGKGMILLVRIGEKIQENQEHLDSLKEQYWGIRKENVLENIDIRIDRAQNILDILEERGYDISTAQSKLDEIRLLRSELEAALDERDNIEILRVSLEALELSKELAQLVKDLQVEIPPKRILQHWVNVGGRVVERTGVIIDELNNLELDTENLETIHSEAEQHLAEAESMLEEGNMVETAEALSQLVDDLIELRDAYIDLVFPDGFPDEIKDAMDNLGKKLEEIAEKLEESLDNM